MERYRQGTPERFWEAFGTVDGGKISYTAICASLRHERKRLDEAIAAQARAEYGGISSRNSATGVAGGMM